MTRGHARTSRSLGLNDPRHQRGQGHQGNEAVQIGEGLTTDREGRLTLDKMPSVPDLPDIYNMTDIGTRFAQLLDALKRSGYMEK